MKRLLRFFSFGLFFFVSVAHAGVILDRVRAIYYAKDRELTVRMINKDSLPAFVKVWMDKGDVSADPATFRVPFSFLPYYRIEPHSTQMLRIVGQGDKNALPQDRESLFYLDVAEFPAVPKHSLVMKESHVGLIFVTRIPFLYRPAQLSGTYLGALRHLKWTVSQQDGKRVLNAINDSFYYIPLVRVNLKVHGKTYTPKNQYYMVPPKGSTDIVLMDIPAKTSSGAVQKATVAYRVRTDLGGIMQLNGSLLQPSAPQSDVK